MFQPGLMRLTSPFPVTLKHDPFHPSKEGDKKKPFTYHTISGGEKKPWTPVKKTYSWYDPTPRDAKGKPTGELQEAQLRVDSNATYTFEEYERNEWENIARAEGWKQYDAYEAMLTAPQELQTEVTTVRKAVEKADAARAALDAKVANVAQNYRTMFKSYDNIRQELTALAVELPVLKDSPFSTKYLLDFIPVVENMLKVELPHLAEDPTTPPPPPAPKPAAEATATGS